MFSMSTAASRVAGFACLAALLFPMTASAGNLATCLLDKLPAVQNDVAANAALNACASAHPGGLQAIPQGAGRGWFSPSSAECTLKKAGDTRSFRAAALISAACQKLYDEPKDLFDELGISAPRK